MLQEHFCIIIHTQDQQMQLRQVVKTVVEMPQA
jgi:hypothetical protein